MTVGKFDRRTALTLAGGVLAVAALRFGVFDDRASAAVPAFASIAAAEKRLERVRQAAASVPGKEAVLKQVSQELAAREKGILQADTAPQAQAQLLDVIQRIARLNGIDSRGAEELRVLPLASDYGEVLAGVTFSCGIEQLVNFLAALANEPQILATHDLHVSNTNSKQKIVQVRLSVSAVAPKKLAPQKKQAGAY